jgi:hypothetical protein
LPKVWIKVLAVYKLIATAITEEYRSRIFSELKHIRFKREDFSSLFFYG